MMESQFSVSWNSYQNNICNGLSSLQQKGEFVDMTLAADGYHVKVHQMVLSLVSPYIKELILSAQCPHPIIFLNKISYTTLCLLLEYAYTGEVQVHKENLSELLEASKALQIKGLDEMINPREMEQPDSSSFEICPETGLISKPYQPNLNEHSELTVRFNEEDENCAAELFDYTQADESEEQHEDNYLIESEHLDTEKEKALKNTILQFTASTHGSPQLVLNRYVYYLRYTRKGTNCRQWRCVDYIRRRCPAYLITKNERVVGRACAHNHPFHDKKIMKKVRDGNIFSALQDVENCKIPSQE